VRVCFDADKSVVLFVPEGPAEHKKLAKFPGFTKISIYSSAPKSIPVVHNLLARLKKQFKAALKVDADVQTWVDQPWKLAAIPSGFKFHTTPKNYQEIALRFLYSSGSAGILLDPGMGKSKVVLDYIFLMGFKKVVIVCPKALLFVWEDEILIHRPELTSYTVQSTEWNKEVLGINSSQVTIINYTKAVTFKHQLKAYGFEFIHLDEFLIKDPSTARTQALTEIGRVIPHRCGGSGTLVNNSPLEIFAPIRFLQPSLVGWSFPTFMERYAVRYQKKDASGERSGPKFVVDFRDGEESKSILDSCCIVMTKDVWLPSLPKKVFHDVFVQMVPAQKEMYECLRSNLIAEIPAEMIESSVAKAQQPSFPRSQYVEVDNALVMLSKLYQISNGFLYDNGPNDDSAQEFADLFGEEAPTVPRLPDEVALKRTRKAAKASERRVLRFPSPPKAAALQSLLEGPLKSKRSIVWFNMSAELEIILEVVEKLGIKHLVIKGGEKHIGEKVRTFNRDNTYGLMICQAKSVNYGITVLGHKSGSRDNTPSVDLESVDPEDLVPELDTQVYTEVFFSLNFSLEVYLQQQDRIHRLGQDQTCEYYRLFCNTPVERKIREAIESKMGIRREMLVDIAKDLAALGVDERPGQ
jgi:SNF2 family DNA or RNA helicase